MSIKIILPEPKIDEKQREQHIRRILGEDKEKKEGLLSQSLVFVHLYQPVSITELKDRIQEYYKLEIERANVFRATDRLVKLGLLFRTTYGDLLYMSESDKESIHRHIEAKHRKFLGKISQQFRKRYDNVNYVWIVNGYGDKFLEWACKLNGFKYEDINDNASERKKGENEKTK